MKLCKASKVLEVPDPGEYLASLDGGELGSAPTEALERDSMSSAEKGRALEESSPLESSSGGVST
jgi:hypothetical protein